jgi:hypothetical protein
MIKHLLRSIFITIVVFSFSVTAIHAKEILFKEQVSGRIVSNPIDINSDGLPASTGIYEGKSTRGLVTVHAFNETMPVVSSSHCPPGTMELLLDVRNIRRFANGDMLFTKSTEYSFVCADLTTGKFSFESKLNIIGGTGRYDGATGTIFSTGSGIALVLDPNTLMNFSAITMKSKGKLMLTDHDSD